MFSQGWGSSCHAGASSPVVVSSGESLRGFGALTKPEVSSPLIISGTGHDLCSGLKDIFQRAFFQCKLFVSGSAGAAQPSAFGGCVVEESKPALLLGLMSLLSPKPSNMGLLMNYPLYFNVRCPPGSSQ